MRVKDIMTKDLITITPDKKVKEAAKVMADKRISSLLVTDESGRNLLGLITESDFIGKEADVPHALASIKQLFGENFYFRDIEKLYEEAKEKPIEEVMTKDIKTTNPDVFITELVNKMIEKNLKRLPVMDNGQLVGIVTRKDIMRTFANDKLS